MVCPCALGAAGPIMSSGGYKATRRNRQLLKQYKQGRSIGFTAKASLKAKGLLPRTSAKYRGKYIVGPKYSRKSRKSKTSRRT